jgi:hypothetical protein
MFHPPLTLCASLARCRLLAAAGCAALLLIGLAAPVAGQPSGGPYGPVQQRYELPAAGHVYVVAPDGVAANPGTVAAPTTLEAAIERVVTGDAIVLRGGVHRTGNLLLNQGITLQPYEAEHPVLKGTAVAKDWEAQPNGLWRTSWTKLFPARPADWWRRQRHGRETPLHLFNNDMVFVDGELLHAAGSEAQVDAHSYYIDYENRQVYLGTDPARREVEITTHDSALVRTTRDVHGRKSDGKGPAIRGLTFTQYAYRGLEVEGTEPEKLADPATFGKEVVGTVLEDVTISFCSRVAGYFRGDNFVVRRCLIADNGTEGLYIIDSADVLLEKNIITRTNVEQITGYYASAVKIFNQSYRAVVRDNLIIDNPDSSGVWWDVGNVDAVFVNNWVQNTNDGFFFEISKGALCAGNVFVNCNKGARSLNSSNVRMYQNTFVNSLASFERNERSAVGDHFGWHPSTGPDVTERHGHAFVNNLLFADEHFAGPLVALDQSPAVRDRLKEPQVQAFDHNVYVRRGGATEPLLRWSPAANAESVATFADAPALTHAYPQFGAHDRGFAEYRGPLFQSTELLRFELLRAFPAAASTAQLPDAVRTRLNLPATPGYPGAFPVRP